MRVSELFEAEQRVPEVSHGKVVSTVSALALKYFKAPATVKQDAQRLVRSTDEFWSSSFDDVTKELQGFYDDVSAGVYCDMYDFFSAVDDAVNDVVEGMRGFYSNRMNHAPGFVPPKFQDDDEPLEIPGNVIKKEFAMFPNFADALKANAVARKTQNAQDKKAVMAAITPEIIQKTAELVDAGWAKGFGKAM